jgi:hypothetical protein
MRTKIASLWQPIAIAALSAANVSSQGTIHVDFRGLAPGEVVSEQFASSGVHFLPVAPGVQPLMTINAPSFFDSSGATVGYAPMFRIRFDQTITSLSFDVGQDSILGSTLAEWRVAGYNAEGPIGGGSSVFPASTHSRAAVTFPGESRVSSILVQGFWLSPGEAFSGPLYIDNINASVVPEPGFLVVFTFGSALLGLWTLRRTQD